MKDQLGSSDEVIRHHASQHPCDSGSTRIECPCGDTIAIICDHCHEPVFVAVQPGTWCEHAQELTDRSGGQA